jgi:HAD superfamily hydrolase (TIGR01509 family)
MPVAPISAVLFDWGDTLFESPHAPRVIVSYAKERGVAVDDVEAERMWDELWDAGKTPAEHAKGRDLSRDAHRRVWTELFSRKETFIPGIGRVLYERVMEPSIWKPYPDTEPTLRALHGRGVRIGIVSNHAYDLRPFFREARLDRYIDAYALSFEVGVAKPARGIFVEACRRLGVAPENMLMVGDDAASDGGAADAGLQLYLLGPYRRGGERGLARVVEIVDASRARPT